MIHKREKKSIEAKLNELKPVLERKRDICNNICNENIVYVLIVEKDYVPKYIIQERKNSIIQMVPKC